MKVHNPKKKLETAFSNIDKYNTTENNKKFIKEFIQFLSAQGIKELRQVKYIYTLCNLSSWIKKDFNSITKKDIQELCGTLEQSKYSEWTKHDYKVTIKKFYTWLFNRENDDIDEWETPREVKWIKIKAPKDSKKVPSDLLTPDDIQLLTDCCRNLREKALLLTLYESGARIGEILSLRIKDVTFDGYGAMLGLNGKTGYRKIRIVGSTPAISQWLQLEHPRRDDTNAFLFCNVNTGTKGEMLSYASATKMLNKIAERSKINKKIYPHLFRHSRATELSEYLNDAPLSAYMGWVKGSQMSRIYTHIEDTNRIILELNGLIKKEKDKRGRVLSVICPRCTTKNPFKSRYCSQCMLPLDVKSMADFNKEKEEMAKFGFNTIENADSTGDALLEHLKRLEQQNQEMAYRLNKLEERN